MKKIVMKIGAHYGAMLKNAIADWERTLLVGLGVALLVAGAITLDRTYVIFGTGILLGNALSYL